MTRSLYVVGGAGAGKSTFMSQLLGQLGPLGPVVNLRSRHNGKSLVTLQGHEIAASRGLGVYLGVMRDQFPGTDALNRACTPVGAVWLEEGDLPDFIVGEGNTLAVYPFMTALARHTELLMVNLQAEEFVKELRFAQRGSTQDDTFIRSGVTRADNLTRKMDQLGVETVTVDSVDQAAWDAALQQTLRHLGH